MERPSCENCLFHLFFIGRTADWRWISASVACFQVTCFFILSLPHVIPCMRQFFLKMLLAQGGCSMLFKGLVDSSVVWRMKMGLVSRKKMVEDEEWMDEVQKTKYFPWIWQNSTKFYYFCNHFERKTRDMKRIFLKTMAVFFALGGGCFLTACQDQKKFKI